MEKRKKKKNKKKKGEIREKIKRENEANQKLKENRKCT